MVWMKVLMRIIPQRFYLAGLVLLVIAAGGYFVFQHVKTLGQQEILTERLEQGLETRKRIDAAVRNSPRDTDGSLRVFGDFLDSRD